MGSKMNYGKRIDEWEEQEDTVLLKHTAILFKLMEPSQKKKK
jgi:hypothetical protein